MNENDKQAEPVAFALRFNDDRRLCLSCAFDTLQEAQDYANSCVSKPVVMPLYTHPPQPVQPAACQYCNGTGDVHGVDGEWRGECTECKTAPAVAVNEVLLSASKLALDCLEVLTFGAECSPHYSVVIIKLKAAIAAAEAEKAKGGSNAVD